jgi:hypothetical protein
VLPFAEHVGASSRFSDQADSSSNPAPRWQGVAVSLEIRFKAFVAFSGWSEDFLRNHCVFVAHQKSKPRAGPRKVFTHSSRRVSLDHCLNASTFERALGQVRLSAATVRFDDHKLGVLHHSIICPDEWDRSLRRALRRTFHLTDF